MRCEFQTSCEQPIRFHERKRDKDWFQLNLMVQWYTPNATPPGCKTFLRKYWPPSSFNGLHKALFPGGWRWGGTLRYPVLFFVNICLTSLAQSNLQSSSHTKMPGTWFRVKDKIWHAKQTTLSTDLTLIGWFYIFLVLNVYPPQQQETWCNYIHDFEFDLRRFCFFSEHVGWVDGWPPGMADVREILFW